MPPYIPKDYSPEEELHKLRTQQEEEASGRREQAEHRIREREGEAHGRREQVQRWLRGERSL